MNRADWMTPEEVLLILGGWCTVAVLLVVGWHRMHRTRASHRQIVRDIAALEQARQETRRGR